MSLHLVLVEPLGPRNVGSVARLCANFGVDTLRLVAPRCDPLSPEARQMAVHGVAHLERAEMYPDLAAALADCQRVVAATGRLEGPPLPLRPPAEALAWLQAQEEGRDESSPPAALVFGREDRGLSNGELLQAGCLLHIPAASTYPSLNLSHAVAVALHQLWTLRQSKSQISSQPPIPSPNSSQHLIPSPNPSPSQSPSSSQSQSQSQISSPSQISSSSQGQSQSPSSSQSQSQSNSPPGPLAPRGTIEAALADAEALLLEVGFLHPHTARARMAKLRALLQRAQLTENDVALLRGMVCQLRWASRR